MRDEHIDAETRATMDAAIKLSRDATRKGTPKVPGDLTGRKYEDLSPRDRYRLDKSLGLDVPAWHKIDAEQAAWQAEQDAKAQEAERKAAEAALAAQRARLGV